MSYRPEINGLKGIAILSVIVNHFNNNILESGYLGVDKEFLAKNMCNKPDELRASYDKEITRVMGGEL